MIELKILILLVIYLAQVIKQPIRSPVKPWFGVSSLFGWFNASDSRTKDWCTALMCRSPVMMLVWRFQAYLGSFNASHSRTKDWRTALM